MKPAGVVKTPHMGGVNRSGPRDWFRGSRGNFTVPKQRGFIGMRRGSK